MHLTLSASKKETIHNTIQYNIVTISLDYNRPWVMKPRYSYEPCVSKKKKKLLHIIYLLYACEKIANIHK